MLSIYTSIYNLSSNIFDWKESLDKFSLFADEVSIATSAWCKDNTVNLLKEYCQNNKKAKLVVTDFDFDDYAFDGKLKNAALQETTHKGKILFDLDEFPVLSQRDLWIRLTEQLYQSHWDGFLIPSINLCGSMKTAKDIAYKFYLHKEGLQRGIVNYAKLDNGYIDITKSDTTDLTHTDNSIANCLPFPNDIKTLRAYKDTIPYVFHKWAVDFDKRIAQNKFWSPIWSSRAGYKVENIVETKEELEKIPVFEHNLPLE